MVVASRAARLLAALAAVVAFALTAGHAEAACPNFAYCTAYAQGTVVTYNGANYTASFAIGATRDCSLYTPATDNWWAPGGTCGSATATATATATRTPTATATSSGGTATRTNTATATATATPTSSGSIGSIVSSSQFDQMWAPGTRSATYTYADFVSAANTYYPALCNTGTTTAKKRECAAYFASKDQETGMGQYDRELYCQPGGGGYGTAPCNYCDTGNAPCGACAGGQQYWGRHAVQLSWNYNYCNGSSQMGLGTQLHTDPNSIFNNKVTGWRASDWYWMTQLGPAVSNGYGTWPQESAHAAITSTVAGLHGFGGVIRAVNGSIECASRIQQQINRVTYFVGGGYNESAPGAGSTSAILGNTGTTADGISGQHLWCSP